MSKLKNYSKVIFIAILICAGGLSAVFMPNDALKGGISCLLFGVAILVVAWIAVDRNKQELNDFNEEANEILLDIAENGEKSQYYHFYNIQIIDKLRKKLQKKHTKQLVSFVALGIIFIIIAIMCMV